MTKKIKDIVTHLEEGKLLVILYKAFYQKEAVFAAAYKFTGLCTIYIEPIDEKSVGIYFKSKNDKNVELKNIAHEFCNEVLDQQVRLDLEQRYGNIRDLIVRHAFSPIKNLKDKIHTK